MSSSFFIFLKKNFCRLVYDEFRIKFCYGQFSVNGNSKKVLKVVKKVAFVGFLRLEKRVKFFFVKNLKKSLDKKRHCVIITPLSKPAKVKTTFLPSCS